MKFSPVVFLGFVCGCSPQSPAPGSVPSSTISDPVLAHQVAEFEINIARMSIARNSGEGGGNHPEQSMIEDMVAPSDSTSAPSPLTPQQASLLDDIRIRILAARAGYDKANTGGLAAWDPSEIIQAAQESATGPIHADVPAALALDEIYASKAIQDFRKIAPQN